MVKKLTTYCIALLLIAISNSCTKKGNTGPAGPAGTSAMSGIAELNGHVSLYDQYGTRQYEVLQNVKLVLNSTTYSYADSTGYYLFPGVASAGYTVSASATGYAATMFPVQLAADTVYRDVKLSAIPDFQVSTFSAYHNPGSQNDSLILTFSPDTRARNCIVFVSGANSVSNMPATYILSYSKAIPANVTRVNIQVPVTDLNGANIFYGDEVYYAAYSYVVNDVSVYEDQATGRNVYNAVGIPVIDSTTSP